MASFSHGFGVASGEVTRPDWPVFSVKSYVPRLIPGVESFGEYQGSGLAEATYLVRNPGGQVVQVSRLLHLVLSGIDGRNTVGEIAARVTTAFGRTVSSDNVDYLLTNKLTPLGLLARADGAADPDPGAGPGTAILALKLRRTLVAEGGVQHLARLFRPLFSPPVVVVVLGSMVAADTWLLHAGRLGPAFRYVLLHPLALLIVLGLSVLSMLFHECGHAAACRYGGARPGVIGMGIYVIWPAFFTNVTDAYRLGRAGRIRTDFGGVYFNAIFALGLTAIYLATGYAPLVAAVVLVYMEILQQLLPSLRFDGYFILADMIGVPDLFQRIAPTLRSMIPGQPADPRVQGLKRPARVALTAWVLVMVPLLFGELALLVFNAPSLATTFGHSLVFQVSTLTGQFRRADVAAGLVSVISVTMLVLPMAGLCYILLSIGRRVLRALIVVNLRRPVLRLPSVAIVLVIAAGLAVHWGILPLPGGRTGPLPAAASHVTIQRYGSGYGYGSAFGQGLAQVQVPARVPARRASVLTPVGAAGFDPLGSSGSDPSNENGDLARYAIDDDPATAWPTQFYLGSPEFGGLKTGSGLILDMGRQVRLRTVTITFGSVPGADVAIEIGNHDTLAAATLPTFTAVASADGVGGTHTFRTSRAGTGRYVLIWFTKLPPAGSGQFQAQIFNIIIRGTALHTAALHGSALHESATGSSAP